MKANHCKKCSEWTQDDECPRCHRVFKFRDTSTAEMIAEQVRKGYVFE